MQVRAVNYRTPERETDAEDRANIAVWAKLDRASLEGELIPYDMGPDCQMSGRPFRNLIPRLPPDHPARVAAEAMSPPRRMKAADIPDYVFLAAVAATEGTANMSWRNRWAVQRTLEQHLGAGIPEKLFMAKARKLMLSKKLHGCPCGCRGDYHLPGDAPCC
jgi:hypothetical protein